MNEETRSHILDIAESLLDEARKARESAYAPYSQFPVGAAILFENGVTVAGCNVENSSYGMSICAERNAMTTAVADGLGKPLAVAVAGKGGEPCLPCGACRQFLAEFNPELPVILEDGGRPVIYGLEELFPLHFALDDKNGGEE